MRPVLMMEVNDGALRAQGSSEAALIATLRHDLSYEILVFSPVTGLVHGQSEGMPLSANIIAVPTEKLAEIVTG